MKNIIGKLTDKENLSFQDARETFGHIFNAQCTPAQIAALLVAFKMKGETEDEIAAAATVIRQKAKKVQARGTFIGIENTSGTIIDTCGTGGSGINKFNISTAVAFVVAAAGITVAKHGNKAISSNSGSADVLEALGIPVSSPLERMQQALHQTGIGFLYAPLYHPALAQVAQIRKEIGVRTIFNILGPLCNPATASHQLLGVYSRGLTDVLAKVLRKLSTKKAFVVYGTDLGDEISLTGPTFVSYLCGKRISNQRLTPSDFGLKKIALKDILVRDANASAQVIQGIFSGSTGAPRNIVLANAAACFYLVGRAHTLKTGVELAAQLLDEGKVKEKFNQFKTFLTHHA